MIIATKSSASTIESSSRMPNARRRRNSSERKVSVLGDIVGRGGVPGGVSVGRPWRWGKLGGDLIRRRRRGRQTLQKFAHLPFKAFVGINPMRGNEVEPVQTAGKFSS